MDMSGSHRIEATREAVWAALNDPDILRQCIPGCEEVVRQSDTEMTAKVVAKVGPVSAKFSGKVTLSDLDPPNGYTITGEGSGGAAGFGKGGATVALSDEDGATLLSYTAKAQVGGKLAQIGSRLVDATARKMAEEFFARFSQIVGAPPADTAAAVEPATAEPVASAPLVAEPPPASDRIADTGISNSGISTSGIVAGEKVTVPPQAVGPAPAAPVQPAAGRPASRMAEPPPEIPLPLPVGRGGSGFYVPWAALLVVVVLLIALGWMS
ncbi:SRPBCC family protein [Azospirillum picis]|uniref:Carbon monoxide dehydrogenase subunit G n=1 Tax=Azospirillum picis TaxID=488438 RepID=A0ABU0MLJ2_9PROT|nr:carbon monoxide dehydrogenase subunit G [Azospirillum picis]MBP2301042.1 carbon monoxide dehydrogenase subunit G [Azospirillum picis]MDQ0534338.1 carbon monoxide dehydrogenase subunit G [Azospirillum picis]